MNFKIGDRVRCIDATFEGKIDILTLKTGMEYVVQDIRKCECGRINLNVGAVAQDLNCYFVCSCGSHKSNKGEVNQWFSSRRFVKVQERYKAVTIQIEKEEHILS